MGNFTFSKLGRVGQLDRGFSKTINLRLVSGSIIWADWAVVGQPWANHSTFSQLIENQHLAFNWANWTGHFLEQQRKPSFKRYLYWGVARSVRACARAHSLYGGPKMPGPGPVHVLVHAKPSFQE